jgi:hypothetical protein
VSTKKLYSFMSVAMRLPNFGSPASANLFLFLFFVLFVFFFVFFIGVYVYIFAFYIFDEIFMRNMKFFGLYFEIILVILAKFS